ncbi:hypothetical protein [Gayadomonas joobiniege]|uniref:hypothetical protein n=1 Tax=Gayadomonas joobiniege TaxID=1234606 RepID=UPI00035FC8FF|nr:hypothetical protein [Gayadomonas joobiniege]
MKAIKSAISIAMLSSLAACGGGGSEGSGESDGGGSQPPVSGEIIISGTVTKGILKDADVVAYKLSGNQWVELSASEIKEDSITTDENGFYQFTLVNYTGPVKIELVATDSTQMQCDAPSGCLETAFGADLDLQTVAPNFTLSATDVAKSDETLKLNVSVLSHIATELASQDLANLTEQKLDTTFSSVANAFGVSGDIRTLNSVNVTDDDAVISATESSSASASLKYGLVNAGIAEALFSNYSETNSLTALLQQAVGDIITAGGQIAVKQDADDDFELTTNDVLGGAANTAAKLKDKLKDTHPDASNALAQTETEITNEKVQKENQAGDDGRLESDGSGGSNGGGNTPTKSERAAAMVNDVRLMTELMGMGAEAGGATANFIPQLENYQALLQDAGVMLENETISFNFLDEIGALLADIYEVHGDEIEAQTLTSKTWSAQTFNPSLTGEVSFNSQTLTFELKQITHGTNVANLNASISGFNGETAGSEFALNIQGDIETETLSFNIGSRQSDKAVITLKLSNPISRQDLEDGHTDTEVEAVDLDLSLELVQKQTVSVSNPIKFSGSLTANVLLKKEPVIVEEYWDGQDYYVVQQTLSLPENLTLSGEFSAADGQKIEASLTAKIHNAQDFETSGYQGFGKTLKNIADVVVTSDLNKITTVFPTGSEIESVEQTFNKDAGSENWTAVYLAQIADGVQTVVHTDRFRAIDVGQPNNRYTFTYLAENPNDDSVELEQVVFEPQSDGSFEVYYHEVDYPSYGSVNAEQYFSSQGLLLDENGDEISLNDYYDQDSGPYFSVQDAIEGSWAAEMIASLENIFTIDTMFELRDRVQQNDPLDYVFNINGYGAVQLARIDLDAGLAQSLDGYHIERNIADAINLNLTEDKNTLTVSSEIDGQVGSQLVYSFESLADDFSAYRFQTTESYPDEGETFKQIKHYQFENAVPVCSEDPVVGGTGGTATGSSGRPAVLQSSSVNCKDMQRITFIVETQHKYADTYFERYQLTAANLFADDYSEEIDVKSETCSVSDAGSASDCDSWNETSSYTIMHLNDFHYQVHGIENVLQAFVHLEHNGYIDAHSNYSVHNYVGNYGSLTGYFDIDNIQVGDNHINGHLDWVDANENLESNNNYLDLMMALSVGLSLDDYQVNLQLTGEREAMDEGTFKLDMAYELPDEQGTRDFSVFVNSKDFEAGQQVNVEAYNSQGVSLMITEPTEAEQKQAEDNGSDLTFGQIKVDDENSAELFWRANNDTFWVRYADGTLESLK